MKFLHFSLWNRENTQKRAIHEIKRRNPRIINPSAISPRESPQENTYLLKICVMLEAFPPRKNISATEKFLFLHPPSHELSVKSIFNAPNSPPAGILHTFRSGKSFIHFLNRKTLGPQWPKSSRTSTNENLPEHKTSSQTSKYEKLPDINKEPRIMPELRIQFKLLRSVATDSHFICEFRR